MTPSVTVFMPVYNGEAFIARALDSALQQDFPGMQVVVADNCSTDGTVAVVSRYLADPRVNLLRRSTNLGMAGNFNACLDAIPTPFYMFLCCDDVFASPRALSLAMAAMAEEPKAAAVLCDLVYVDIADNRVGYRRFARRGMVLGTALLRQSIVATRNMYGIPVVIRTSAVGGLRYNPALSYVMDVDLFAGMGPDIRFYHIPEVLIANRFHSMNTTLPVIDRALDQMRLLAGKYGVRLGAVERLRQRANHAFTVLRKRLFFAWLALRHRSGGRP